MNKGEALKLGNRINKALRPFKQATDVLAAAVAAESAVVDLTREHEKLTGLVERLTETITGLVEDQTRAEEGLRAVAAATAGEQATLDVAKTTTADALDLLTAQEDKARLASKEVLDGLRSAADEAEARLAGLHTEEERIDEKLAKFHNLSQETVHEQE